MTRHGDPWWSLFRTQRRRRPATPSVALDVHLRVLRRKIGESGWTHDKIRGDPEIGALELMIGS